MARKYFGFTTTHFGRVRYNRRVRHIRRYRRYGNKTYLIGKYSTTRY